MNAEKHEGLRKFEIKFVSLEETKARERAKDDGPGKLEGPDKLLEKVKDAVANLGAGLGAAADRISVSGTFSGHALGLLGGGTAVDRIAAATEATAKNTKGINKGKGPTFK